jgi:hypothetical protein
VWLLRFNRDGYSVEAGIKKRRALPPDHWYLNEPEAPEGCEFFFDAYRDLSTCRPAEGPIPWTAVALYAEFKGLEPDNADRLWSVIRKMDAEERRWHAEDTMTVETENA